MPTGIYTHKKYQGFQKGNQLWKRKKKKSVVQICRECSKQFEIFPSQIDRGGGKYCSKTCKQKAQKKTYLRNKNPRWHGGKTIHSQGYRMVLYRDHPHAHKHRGYVYEHRLVMEEHLGRYLEPYEIVCHLNGDPKDNRLENLRVFENKRDHFRYHKSLKK